MRISNRNDLFDGRIKDQTCKIGLYAFPHAQKAAMCKPDRAPHVPIGNGWEIKIVFPILAPIRALQIDVEHAPVTLDRKVATVFYVRVSDMHATVKQLTHPHKTTTPIW
jgi:hypothetical protein